MAANAKHGAVIPISVIPGLVPGIQASTSSCVSFLHRGFQPSAAEYAETWIPATGAGMTSGVAAVAVLSSASRRSTP